MAHRLRALFLEPIAAYTQWAFVLVTALAFIFMPQLPPPSDWERNTADLARGLSIYANPSYVYPPWAIILLWPYRLMTATGSRILSVLTIGWLASRRRWSLREFFVIVISPFFLWTMTLSNADILVMVFPIILWEAVEGTRFQGVGRGMAMAILLVKPQGGVLPILYWLWTNRKAWRGLLLPLLIVALIVIPISLVGRPSLIVQFLDNVSRPSLVNQEFWRINNVSISQQAGWLVAVIVVPLGAALVIVLLRLQGRPWMETHTLSAMFLASMLLSPYASNQSVIVPLALVPSWQSLLVQYVIVFGGTALDIYRDFDPWWTLGIGLSALWLYRPAGLRDTSP